MEWSKDKESTELPRRHFVWCERIVIEWKREFPIVLPWTCAAGMLKPEHFRDIQRCFFWINSGIFIVWCDGDKAFPSGKYGQKEEDDANWFVALAGTCLGSPRSKWRLFLEEEGSHEVLLLWGLDS